MKLTTNLLSISILLTFVFATAYGQTMTPPPPPEIPPIISETYSIDQDGDCIEDELQYKAQDASTAYWLSTTQSEKNNALTILGGMIDVELIFKEPVTQEQIDDFLMIGGEIIYIFQTVSYGWNGRIPLEQINTLPELMGPAFVLIKQPRDVVSHMDVATRVGRVRPIWKGPFAGNVNGFDGDPSITIGTIDRGADGNHRDLSGRNAYWKDWGSDHEPNPVDYNGHGSHVAGIAVGSGEAGGKGTGRPYYYTQTGDLTLTPSNRFIPEPITLPSGFVRWNSTAWWVGGGQATLANLQVPKDSNQAWSQPSGSQAVKEYSPLSLDDSFVASSDNLYSAALLHEGNVHEYVILNEITDPSGSGDEFNKFSGVAPGCKWAAAKIYNNSGSGVPGGMSMAFDDLIQKNRSRNIKVINVSQGLLDSESRLPTEDETLRNKFNTGIKKGVVVVVSAGNNADAQTTAGKKMADPARTAMAITVGASNDENNLTTYSTYGFSSPDSSEDYKPDVIAPGGSIFSYTRILSVDSDLELDGEFSDCRAHDYTSKQGTSMAAPFVAGCAALVIDAMQQKGITWNFNSDEHPRYVKMVLCATATETNEHRENNVYNPSLQRAAKGPNNFPEGKDPYEGYGIINPDAAVEAVSLTYSWGTSAFETLGSNPSDRRAWARTVQLSAGGTYTIDLVNPSGCDADLYLYDATPSSKGTPVMLRWSTATIKGANEHLTYTASSDMNALIVVKRVSGSGRFELKSTASGGGDDSLIGWWKFDGDTLDSSGSGNHGTAVGNPTFVSGKIGSKAIYLDDSDYVVIDDVADDITNNNITLCGWFKTTDVSGFLLSCNGAAGGNVNKVLLGIRNGNAVIYDGASNAYECDSGTNISNGVWHMVSYVRMGSTGYLYIDGSEKARHTPNWTFASTDRWSIGQEWDDLTPGDFVTGTVDDVRMYDRALTSAEIADLYQR